MAKIENEVKIEYVTLKGADNGFILTWSEYCEGEGEYGGREYLGEKQRVFLKTQGKEAAAALLEMYNKQFTT